LSIAAGRRQAELRRKAEAKGLSVSDALLAEIKAL
jgi:hypothetical protein